MRKTSCLLLGSLLMVLVSCGDDDDNRGSTSASKCKALETEAGKVNVKGGCVCDDKSPDEDTLPFPEKCTAATLDSRATCCQTSTQCYCYQPRCGTSSLEPGYCVCTNAMHILLSDDRTSCTDSGTVCCQLEAKYGSQCECSNATQCGFGSYQVSSCDLATVGSSVCDPSQKTVSACE